MQAGMAHISGLRMNINAHRCGVLYIFLQSCGIAYVVNEFTKSKYERFVLGWAALQRSEATMTEWNSDERNVTLRALDVDHMQALFPSVPAEILLGALHKARYDCTDIEDALRLESAEWLRARGLNAMGGVPLLPPGELPRGTGV
jgi:hypothetical protein